MPPESDIDSNPEYWAEYSPLQHVKHDLIRRYLGGWFAKLGSWAGRVVYVDTHAGRGRHATGELGSPLVALKVLLDHSHRSRLLATSEFQFHLIERDRSNLMALRREIAALGPLPDRIIVAPHEGDCFAVLGSVLKSLHQTDSKRAPAFVFVDPYGFRIPGGILRQVMDAGRVELFVNVIWRELNMSLVKAKTEEGHARVLDEIFDGTEWRTEVTATSSDDRADEVMNLMARKLSARWPTFIRMLHSNGATRYILLHLTNHEAGRDLMKDCMWAVCPDGGFVARKSEDPAQQVLISREPDLRPLRRWVAEQLAERPARWADLLDRVRPLVWRGAHVNEIVRAMRREGEILATGYSGRFSERANPLLCLPGSPEKTWRSERQESPPGRRKP